MKFLEYSVGATFCLVFVAWVFCLLSWIRRGMPIPRYIHFVAVALTLAGAVFLAFALTGGFFEWKLGLACLALPAPLTYLGWLWLFGPQFSSESQGTTGDVSDHPAPTTSEQDRDLG